MGLRDQIVDSLRSVFGREREERQSAESPSDYAQANVGPSSFNIGRSDDIGGMLSVSNHLMDRYSDYECFTGDTKVLTLQGPIRIDELAKECAKDPDKIIYLYTWDGSKIDVGMGINARPTKLARVYTVLLDDGQSIRATYDHPFMMRDGSYKTVGELRKGDSLMPLYLSKDENGNILYQHNSDLYKERTVYSDSNITRKVSRLVAEWKYKESLPHGTVVEHKDGDKNNCDPDNIVYKFIKDRKKAKWLDSTKKANEFISSLENFAKPPFNHKVVSVIESGEEYVYDLSVPGTNNFAVGSDKGGVFVHNCMDEYPDINCLSGDTLVSIIDGSFVKNVPISDIARDGDGTSIIGYNIKKRSLEVVPAIHPRRSGKDVDVIELKLSNGSSIKCTGDHKILIKGKGYVDAKLVKKDDILVGLFSEINKDKLFCLVNKNTTDVSVLSDPIPAGKADVYDITTKTHNFIAGGVVVHNSAHHYFANDAVQPDLYTGRSVWVESRDGAVKDAGNSLLHKKLRIDDDIFSMAYTLCKYGNDYEEVLVTENGVIGLNYLPVPTMRRIELNNGALAGFVQDPTGKFTSNMDSLRQMLGGTTTIPSNIAVFEGWQVMHMRLRSTHRRSPYGYAISDGARWIWKRLTILEDAVLIYRLTRAPSRYAFYIDVTDIPANRVESFLRKAKSDLKKKKIINPRTGQLEMRYNPMANDEDFFLATKDGRDLSRVEVISGPTYQHMEDIEYFQRKLHGVLKVPREYLGQDQSVPARAILSNEDSRAARVTMNIQKEMRNSVERLVRIDMSARGVQNPFLPDVNVVMTAPSGIYALQDIEVKNARADFASRILPFTSLGYIRRNVLEISDAEAELIERERREEAKAQLEISQLSTGSDDEGGVVPPPNLEYIDVKDLRTLSEVNRGSAPTKAALQKMIDEERRKEDIRDRESRKRHDEITEKMNLLIKNDRAFARSMNNLKGFNKDFKSLFYKNGSQTTLPPPSKNGRKWF